MSIAQPATSIITDIFDAPPVQHHLDNWGPWAWIGMVLLTLVVAAVANVVAAIIPRDLDIGMSICANILLFLHGTLLYLVMRHIPHEFLVWVIAIVMTIIMCVVISRVGQNNPTSYIGALAANLGPAVIDLWIARSLAGFPTSWAMAGAVVTVIVVAVFWNMFVGKR